MAQQLRALTVLPEDPIQFPAAHGSSQLSVTPTFQFKEVQCSGLQRGTALMWCTDLHDNKAPINIKKKVMSTTTLKQIRIMSEDNNRNVCVRTRGV